MRSAIVIVLVVALSGGCDRQSPPAAQGDATAAAGDAGVGNAAEAVPPPSPDEAPAAAPAAVVGAFDRSHRREPAPAATFTDPAGAAATLARFAGRPVLVNLWATWCAPCVKELPTLDALAAQPGAPAVLAIAQDSGAKVKPFWAAHGYRSLKPSLDPALGWSVGLGVNLPTTILYDSAGKEVWRYVGSLDWTGAAAAKALAEAR